MTTGQRIKSRRKSIGLSAEQLAEFLGCAPATIYRYENGDIEKVPGDRLGFIAKVLQTTPAFLMGWDEDSLAHTTNPASLPYEDGVFPYLLKTYETLNADGRQKVYERAIELAELPKYQLTPATDMPQSHSHGEDAYLQRIGVDKNNVPSNWERADAARVAESITLPSSEDANDKK